MSDPVIARLRALLAHQSGAQEASLGPGSTPQNTGGWDSAANLGLMVAIEDEYGITIATRDVIKLRSLGDLAAYVEARTAAGRPG